MACEGHHPLIVQKYHINQHEVASKDIEISFESGFCKILTAYVGTICLIGTTNWTCLLYQNPRTTLHRCTNIVTQSTILQPGPVV